MIPRIADVAVEADAGNGAAVSALVPDVVPLLLFMATGEWLYSGPMQVCSVEISQRSLQGEGPQRSPGGDAARH